MKKTILFFSLCITVLLYSCNSEGEKGKPNDSTATKTDTSKVDTSKSKPNTMTVSADPKEGTKTLLTELFKIVKEGDYSKAAPYLAYKGMDAARKWKTPFNYSDEKESTTVDKICSKISVILNDSKEPEFTNFKTDKESEGEWLVWTVSITYNDGTDAENIFGFLKSEKGEKPFLLGEID